MVQVVYPPEDEELEEDKDETNATTNLAINNVESIDTTGWPKAKQENSDSDNFHAAPTTESKSTSDSVKGKVICKIVSWWVATVPVALLFSFSITKLII